MKTQIFSYKDAVGAITDLEKGKFINDPKGSSQLGCVIDVKECLITKEAKTLIKNAPREGGSFAPIMLTKHSGSTDSSIGIMGHGFHLFHGEGLCIGRECETEVLDNIEENEFDIPPDFMKAVDNL